MNVKRILKVFVAYVLVIVSISLLLMLEYPLIRDAGMVWAIILGTINLIVMVLAMFLLGYYGYRYLKGGYVFLQILAVVIAGLVNRSLYLLISGKPGTFLSQLNLIKFITLGFVGLDNGYPHLSISPDFLAFFLGMWMAYRRQKKKDTKSMGDQDLVSIERKEPTQEAK